jgi:hypothetical protein
MQKGAMDMKELDEFCIQLRNKSFFFKENVDIAQQKIKESNTVSKDGLVDLYDLTQSTKHFQAAFYPIIQFQRKVRVATLGEIFWFKVLARSKAIQILVKKLHNTKGILPSLSFFQRIQMLWNKEIAFVRKQAVLQYEKEIKTQQQQQVSSS